jgi:hypothetical protein
VRDKKFILENIFGEDLVGDDQQIELPNDPIAFVKRETYNEEITSAIIDWITYFIRVHILREEEMYNSDSIETAPIIVVLDNSYFMDLPSWKLLEKIKLECNRISIIILQKID